MLVEIGGSVSIKKIAVIGLFSAGKTTFCQTLSKLGAYVVIADDLVHEVLAQDNQVIALVREQFGEKIFTKGKIDRKKLAAEAFSDKKQLQVLEQILHPRALARIQQKYQTVQENPRYKCFVVECAVLERANWLKWFDDVWAIIAPKELCIQRAEQKGYTATEWDMRSQWTEPPPKLAKQITNTGSLEQLQDSARDLLATI